jgi:hypothetical protein
VIFRRQLSRRLQAHVGRFFYYDGGGVLNTKSPKPIASNKYITDDDQTIQLPDPPNKFKMVIKRPITDTMKSLIIIARSAIPELTFRPCQLITAKPIINVPSDRAIQRLFDSSDVPYRFNILFGNRRNAIPNISEPIAVTVIVNDSLMAIYLPFHCVIVYSIQYQ